MRGRQQCRVTGAIRSSTSWRLRRGTQDKIRVFRADFRAAAASALQPDGINQAPAVFLFLKIQPAERAATPSSGGFSELCGTAPAVLTLAAARFMHAEYDWRHSVADVRLSKAKLFRCVFRFHLWRHYARVADKLADVPVYSPGVHFHGSRPTVPGMPAIRQLLKDAR